MGGRRQTMFFYGLMEVAIIIPLAIIFLHRPPESPYAGSGAPSVVERAAA